MDESKTRSHPWHVVEYIAKQTGPYKEGCQAYIDGLSVNDSPYEFRHPNHTVEGSQWLSGYCSTQAMVIRWTNRD